MVALLGGSVASFAVPALLGFVVNRMEQNSFQDINAACLWMIAIIAFSSVASGIRGFTFNTISERIAKHLRYDLLMHLLNKDVAFYDIHKTGDLLSRLSNDVTVVQNGLGTNVSMFARASVTIIVSIAILSYISW